LTPRGRDDYGAKQEGKYQLVRWLGHDLYYGRNRCRVNCRRPVPLLPSLVVVDPHAGGVVVGEFGAGPQGVTPHGVVGRVDLAVVVVVAGQVGGPGVVEGDAEVFA